MSKVSNQRIHPAVFPPYCVVSGERDGGDLGFWVGPDIEARPGHLITPHVSRRMAKQWLEDAGLVVDINDFAKEQELRVAAEARADQAEKAVEQLQKRLGRVFPGRRKVTA